MEKVIAVGKGRDRRVTAHHERHEFLLEAEVGGGAKRVEISPKRAKKDVGNRKKKAESQTAERAHHAEFNTMTQVV